jgi:threonine dehydrogenase-like Zn-dependent dehydrogenase
MTVTEMPTPTIAPGEALVRVQLTGVCRTDLELAEGLYGFCGVPGHEFVGEVTEGIGGADWKTPCRRDQHRLRGVRALSPRRTQTLRTPAGARDPRVGRGGGAFAEYLRLPVCNLHPVPDSVSDEEAVFTEPLAAALDVPRRVLLLGAADRVLVIGAGKLAQLVCRVLLGQCAELAAVARHPARLERLPGSVKRLIGREVPARHYDVVVDCSGSPRGFETRLEAVRPEGTLVVKSTMIERAAVDVTRLVVDEIRVLGSRCGPFDEALALLAGAELHLHELIDARYPLDQAVEAFAHAGRAGAMKVVVEPVTALG